MSARLLAQGGRIVAEGDLQAVYASPESITGDFLSGKGQLPFLKKEEKSEKRLSLLKRHRTTILKEIDCGNSL